MASQIASELEDTVRRVPMIGWVALAGGAALFVFARHNSTAANILNPNAATPNVDSGALPGQVFPSTTDTGGSVSPGTTPDPNATPVVPPPDYHQKTTDILGGTLGHFIAGLTNQPDFVNYTSGDQSITESSGVATFGGGGGTALQAPDWLRAQGDYLAASDAGQAGIISATGAAQAGNTAAWGAAQAAIANAWANAIKILNPGQGYYDPNANRILPPAPPVGVDNPRFLGPPVAAPPPAPAPAPAPSNYWGGTSCNSGNYSCIKYACHSGDTACAHSVAPWWRGDKISGW